MEKNIKEFKEKQKKKIITNIEVSYEITNFEDEFQEKAEFYEIDAGNYSTYKMCELNQKKTGWFYPDDDLEFIDTLIDEDDKEI